jgi:hypothetical protein
LKTNNLSKQNFSILGVPVTFNDKVTCLIYYFGSTAATLFFPSWMLKSDTWVESVLVMDRE